MIRAAPVLYILFVCSISLAQVSFGGVSVPMEPEDATLKCQSAGNCQRTEEMYARDFVAMVVNGNYDRNASTAQLQNPEIQAASAVLAEAREIVMRENSSGRPTDIIAAILVTPTSLDMGTISKTIKQTQAIVLFVTESENLK